MTRSEPIARALSGSYLLVAFSDGDYALAEKVSLTVGVLSEAAPAGLSSAELEAAFQEVTAAFERDYDKAAEQALSDIAECARQGVMKRAIADAARRAVVADNAVKQQEELALDRIAGALGMKAGDL